jgi:hypothetical protein
MSHHSHLLASIRRTPRQAQPFDSLSKAELWDRLRAAEQALAGARSAAQSAATMAHNYAQGASGEGRRQMLAVRDAAYKARDAA